MKGTRQVGVLGLVVPMGIGALSQVLLGMADTAIVGHYERGLPLAAVGTAAAVYAVAAQMVLAFAMAFEILAARAVGAGDRALLARLLRHGIGATVALALLLGAVLLAAGDAVVGLFLPPGESREAAVGWLQLRTLGLVALGLAIPLRGALDVDGRPVWGMGVSLAQNLVNVAATSLLVFGWAGFPELGVPGSALGSTISDLFALAALVLIHLRLRVVPFLAGRGWSPAILKDLVNLGAPELVNAGLDYVGTLLFVAVVATVGPVAIAGSQVAFTVLMILFAISMVFGLAVQITIGRAIGAGDRHAARERLRDGLVIGLGTYLVVAVALLLAPRQVAGLFASSEATVQAATPALRAVAVSAPLMVLAACLFGVLRAYRRTPAVMQVNLACVYLVQLPVAVLLTRVLDRGVGGAYVGFVAYFACRSAISLVLVRRTLSDAPPPAARRPAEPHARL
jgi:MATE family multidrug resistance protein